MSDETAWRRVIYMYSLDKLLADEQFLLLFFDKWVKQIQEPLAYFISIWFGACVD